MLTIELAKETDVPALCELLAVLFAQEAEFKPDFDTQRRGLSDIIRNPDVGVIFLARDNDSIRGMVSLLFTISTALGAKVALLEDMIVAEHHRHEGIGSALINHAIAFARTQQCKRITVLTDRDNHKAHRFYVKHGFAGSPMMPMRLLLNESRSAE